MNREQAKKLLPVIQAFAEGRSVQYQCPASGVWMDVEYPGLHPTYQWRIKPEPRELWAVYNYNGEYGGSRNTEREALVAAADWDKSFPSQAPHTVVRFREVL